LTCESDGSTEFDIRLMPKATRMPISPEEMIDPAVVAAELSISADMRPGLIVAL
jgi:hypothetical protein